MNSYFLLLLILLTFIGAFLGTWLIIRLSKTRHWLDIPNDRSSHSAPTPTAGGVAFVVAFIIAALIGFNDSGTDFNYLLILGLSFCVALMGLIDDIFQLGIGPRIFTQFIAVLVLLGVFGIPVISLFGVTMNPAWLTFLFLALGLIWFINLFNFMDGIDGIAATQTLFMGLSITGIIYIDQGSANSSDISLMLLILLAAVSGFLLLNVAPAKIFMGDTGSYFLGFILGASALVSTTSALTNVWVWCILASVFIVDASCTLLSRFRQGETWYYAHRTHAYQLMAHYYESHGNVIVGILVINCCWLLPIAWLAQRYPVWGFLLTIVAWAPLILLVNKVRKSQKIAAGVR